jgi:pimeloyl-ACP methyl ester carboxylesterase
MRRLALGVAILFSSLLFLPNVAHPQTTGPAFSGEKSPEKIQFVEVETGVRLEVVDWGGRGPAIVFLAGSGNTAHVFESFAPELTDRFHVYGITRRGYGASSAPASGYTPTRLGDDILNVIEALQLKRPLLVGHSIAGEELSSIAARYPSRVAGLVYLDAAYPFAYQNPNRPNLSTQFDALFKEAEAILPPQHITSADLLSVSALQDWLFNRYGIRFPLAELQAGTTADPAGHITGQKASPATAEAMHDHEEAFNSIPVPTLAVYAIPHSGKAFLELPPDVQDKFRRKESELLGNIASDFQDGVPQARVVRIPGANHYVFLSNPSEVLSEIRSFAVTLFPPEK